MNFDLSLILWLGLFLGASAIIFLVRWKNRAASAGLVYTFLFALLLNHGIAPAFYFRTWVGASPLMVVLAGLRLAAYAVIAFAVGSLVAAPVLLRFFKAARPDPVTRPHSDLPFAYIVVGCCAYAVGEALRNVPSSAAVLSASQQFLLLGIALKLREAWIRRNLQNIAIWALATLALPFFTILTQGFLGFGAMAAFTIMCFLCNSIRSLWRFGVSAVILGFLFLSLYVSYMRDRGIIRNSVWGGQSLDDRTEKITTMLKNLEWFDPTNDDHARRIDSRMDQNVLVGRAVEHMEGRDSFVYGETLRDAALAVIPRAIWPDKPISAGSGNLVTRFTGIRFAQGTSVGIGQVMEAYVNFGTWGVWGWFFVTGMILGIVDVMAGLHLRSGDWQTFSLWYLPALNLTVVSGQLVEVTAAATASVVVGLFLNRVILHKLQSKRPRRGASNGRSTIASPVSAT